MSEKPFCNIMSAILVYIWTISWFIAIWVPDCRLKLLITGAFSFVLAVILYEKESK